jgi:hypothetical protein
MDLTTMKKRVASNIGQLASDASTIIDSSVTGTEIGQRINELYREELFPFFARKYPEDFWHETYPLATYTATGTVSASSTGTTLVASTSIFNNSMEGFTVYNATDSESAVISSYTSGTTVTLDTTIDDDWDGDTIYILGNEYTFGGDAADLFTVARVGIKYSSSDTYFKTCELTKKRDAYLEGSETYSKVSPLFYRTTITVNNIPKQAIGILPFPDHYAGRLVVWYVERPPELGASDEPMLTIQGISEVLVNGVSAWAFAKLKMWEESERYQQKYERGKVDILKSYKPSYAGTTKLRLSTRFDASRRN